MPTHNTSFTERLNRERDSRPAGNISAAGLGAAPILAANSPDDGRALSRPQTLVDAIRLLASQEAGIRRDHIRLSKLRIDADRLIVGEHELALGDAGVRRLCGYFKNVPPGYVSGLPPELQARVLQHHLRAGGFSDQKVGEKNCLVLSRDGQFLSLGRADLHTLSSVEVLQAAGDGIGADALMRVQDLRANDEGFTLDLISPRVVEEVRPGDILHGGVRIEHSPTGGRATTVAGFVIRLVCANGLVQRECTGPRPRSTARTRRLPADRAGARELQINQIRRLAAEAWRGLEGRLAAIRRLRDEALDDVQKDLERFLRQARVFSRGLMARLRRAWEEEGAEPSAFGLLNALTRVATHATDLDAGQRGRLARLAGVYANHQTHVCPHCFSMVRTG